MSNKEELTKRWKEEQQVRPVSSFIGARLQYPCPEINGQGNPWVSTIRVSQHKEKFFYARVYCRLAAPELVKNKWDWLQANEELRKNLTSRRIFQGPLEGPEPTAEFGARCFLHDAIWYRTVYREMVDLLPHMSDRICRDADYNDLLHAGIENFHAKFADPEANKLEWMLSKYRAADAAALEEFMGRVYHPSYRRGDKMEWID